MPTWTNVLGSGAVVVFVGAAAWTVTACGDDDAGEPPKPSADAGADAPIAASGTLKVLVVAPDEMLAAFPPAQGAWVSVDLPGGRHRELPVGADGRVEIKGVDWSLGTATVIAFGLPKRSIYGVTGVGPDTFGKLPKPKGLEAAADVVLYPSLLGPAASLTVTGVTRNAQAPTNPALVSGAGCSSTSESVGSFVVTCRASTPITLLVRDESITPGSPVVVAPDRWFKVDVPAQAAGAVQVDVDFTKATAQPAKRAKVDVVTTAALRAVLTGSNGNVHTTSRESFPAFLGAFTSRAAKSDGYGFELEWVELPGQSTFTFGGIGGATGQSFRHLPRAPKDGERIDGLMVPLKLAPLDLANPVDTSTAPPTAVQRLSVTSGPGFLFTLDAPPGTAAIRVPAGLPAEVRPPGAATGTVVWLDQVDAERLLYLSAAYVAPVAVTFPP